MPLFKSPIDYRSQYRNLSNDELTAITKNQTGQYDARAVQVAQELLNARHIQEYGNQPVMLPLPPREKKKQTWIWWVAGYLLFRLIMAIIEKSK